MELNHRLGLPDADIAFWDTGEGEPVLLVHASFGADWFAPLAQLLPGYRVVRSHRAGYGGSRDLSGELSLVDHTRHLAKVLRSRGIGQAHVVGHSTGGSIALQLAAGYPELVRSMVLLEPAFPYAPDEPKFGAMGKAIAAAKEGDLEQAFDFFPGGVCSPGYRDAFIRTLGADGLEESIRSGVFPLLAPPEVLPALREGIEGPLNMVGDPNKASLTELARRGATRITFGPRMHRHALAASSTLAAQLRG